MSAVEAEPERSEGSDRSEAPLKRAVSLGLAAARANLRPALALWAVGLAILAAYYLTAWGEAAFGRLSEFRGRSPWLYAAVATPLFGAVIPWLVMRGRQASRGRATPAMLGFMAVFWAERGIEVNALYAGLAWWIGDTREVGVILAKIAFDQGLYAPLWAVPTMLLAYRWHDHGYRLASLGVVVRRRWWIDDVIPVVLANSAVWTPAVAMIYALPLALQLPAQNLVLCFWSLVLLFMTDGDTKSRRSTRSEHATGP